MGSLVWQVDKLIDLLLISARGFITWEQFKPIFEKKLREDEDERELREAFRVLDKNSKGVIGVDDLRWILRSLGDDLTDEEIEDMIMETDTDGSGTVDYEGRCLLRLVREREMFYLTTHSTHFIYGYMASDIWLRTILIVRKETRCRLIGYSYRLTARVLLYAPSHRQDCTHHGLCYTSRGALAGTRNSSMGPPH